MRDVTNTKSLNDLRTATTHHIASKPPRKGTTYLDLYALSMEKQRLEKELSRMEHRGKRIHERLGEIRKAMSKLDEAGQREREMENAKTAQEGQTVTNAGPQERQWKKMTVEY
ncbi:MAG: hypothetical protein HYU86_07925 [Chloroflexi bacterium]|nr:hypothetical protein [Chloroflexota bacterium]